ncbi:LEA type 2 family protein [Pyrococcus abyssi]|uniref:Water stress and hypersensitive response domain-containing protein n=1 Tax=Pyrococcus abyssi (strain GE5 / Orsay) TaxID=272844 RepID=Q9V273_PYRAB|nr:LEA type 2 family protein [Pyrococcus abyssi]CAB49125.1 Hypothetical protein PAB0133 [Pyrococcus abyssi GE5]CCE69577.1 TPA: hypothetical protein PAB0133 [Pyrococcus abyssi GE5]
MGKVGAIIGIIFLSWLLYSAYFVMNFSPTVRGEWGPMEGNNVEIIFHVDLGNPSPIPVAVQSLNLSLAGVEIGRIEQAKIGIFERSTNVVAVVNLDKIAEALVNHIKDKENSIAEINANIKVLGFIPIKYSKTIPVKTNILSFLQNVTAEPRVYSLGMIPFKTPGIEGIYARWGKVSTKEIELVGTIKLYNPNSFPIPVTNLKADMYMNNIKIGEGRTLKGTILQPNSRGTVDVALTFDVEKLKEAFKEHIRNGERSTVKVDIELVVEVGGAEYEVPIKDIETTFETNILSGIKFA